MNIHTSGHSFPKQLLFEIKKIIKSHNKGKNPLSDAQFCKVITLRRQRYGRANYVCTSLNLLPTFMHRSNNYVPNPIFLVSPNFLRHGELMHETLSHIYEGFRVEGVGEKTMQWHESENQREENCSPLLRTPTPPGQCCIPASSCRQNNTSVITSCSSMPPFSPQQRHTFSPLLILATSLCIFPQPDPRPSPDLVLLD